MTSNTPTLRLVDQPADAATVAAIPAPSIELGEEGLLFWEEMNRTFNFHGETHKLRILEQAAKTLDTIAYLEEQMVDQPVTVLGSAKQLTIHPILDFIGRQRTAFTNQIKALKLPDSDEEAASKAERRTKQARKAANVRHNPGGTKK